MDLKDDYLDTSGRSNGKVVFDSVVADEPEHFKDKLIEVSRNNELRKKMATNSKDFVRVASKEMDN